MPPNHVLSIPWRPHITYMADGTKQIQITLNGHIALILEYDPKTDIIKEVDPQSPIEVKTHYTHG